MKFYFQAHPQQVLALAIDGITSHLSLWHNYFNDFISYKLKLADQYCYGSQGDYAQQILRTYLESLHYKEALCRIAELHCYFSVHQLQLAKVATILRHLDKIERVRKVVVTTL